VKNEDTGKTGLSDQPATIYVCMPRPKLDYGSFSVEAVQPRYIESIRQWRNAQMDILRQSTAITPEQQEAYFREYIWPDMRSLQPKNLLLAYMENGNFIGYGGLVHIAWEHRRAEVSFLLKTRLAGTQDDYNRYFPSFLKLMKILAFDDLGFERLYTETYAVREQYILALETMSFRCEGVLRHHVRINDQPVDSFIHGCLQSYD
jgi:RimJ/RimL family protein N-acetyltransferase